MQTTRQEIIKKAKITIIILIMKNLQFKPMEITQMATAISESVVLRLRQSKISI